jgi:hypothetical protein
MGSAQITRIYARLGRLFALQRKSLLAAASAGFKMEDEEEFESRHSRIVELYQELGKLNPAAYPDNARAAKPSPADRKAS